MAENQIDRLEIQVQAQAQKANADLDKLVGKLERMSSSLSRLNAGGLKNLANGVDTLGRSVQNMSTVKTSDFTRLAKNIEKLGNINQAGINNTANALRQISSALTASTVSGEALKGLSDLANGISRLGYKSVSNAITNLPLLANSMRQFMQTLSSAPQVSQNLIQMTNAMANLASQGSKYNSAIKSMGSAARSLSRANTEAYKSNINLMAGITKLTVGFYILRRAVRAAFEPINKAMNVGETINLFQTSFKKIGMQSAQYAGMEWGSEAANAFAMKFIDYAQSFNNQITEALSLDPNVTMKYQAVFAQMANAFGLTSKSVMNLSSSFTMLGLDIASFFNTGVEEAMVKLRAGLAGETEPLRALGVDITETTLKMTAMKYGIDDSVASMSQAAKTQLRWLAIMDQTDTVFGDMAKTIESPANQARILQQQLENLSRSLGSVFLPIVQTVLPYINAFVIALRRMADTIAGAMGYELPDYTGSDIYQDITGDIGEIETGADDATKSANKLKKALASFDELNILGEGKVKGINLNIGGGYDSLDDAITQKTDSYMAKFNEELSKMGNKAEELANRIQPKLEKFVEFMGKIEPLLKGIAAAFVTYKVVDWFSKLGTVLGNLNPTAGVVALAVLAIVAIYEAVKEYNKKLVEEDLAKRFGDIALSMEEIETVAKRLTESKYTANIDIYVTEKQKLEQIEKNIQTDIETLNKLNWKVSVGLALTEGEAAQYKATIESFIANSEAYIEQQHYVTKLAIDAVIQDKNFNKEISQLVDEYFNGSKSEMTRLGKQLRSEMDNALADGIIDAQEQKVIDNLIKEISQIQERVASAEFKAKLQMIELEGDLTPETYKKLFEQIQTAIEERSKGAEEAAFTILASLNASYQIKMDDAKTAEEKAKIQKEWDADIQEIRDNLNTTKAEITYDGITFITDKLIEKWGPELDKAKPEIERLTTKTMNDAHLKGLMESDPSYGVYALVDTLLVNYQEALSKSGMNKASRTALEEMLKELEPTEADNKKIYEEALKTGNQIPQAIVDEMSSIKNLHMLLGDEKGVDAVLYAIGQQLANSPEILKMIANGEVTGKDLDDSIIRGLKSKIPDLRKEGDNLIFNVNDAIKKSAESKAKNDMPKHSKGIIDGFNTTFEKDTTGKSAAKTWLDGIASTVRGYDMPHARVGVIFEYDGIPSAISKGGQIIQQYAGGGQPNTGEFFMARENGIPEYVGRMGGKTTVANNADISAGIEEAAYRGYMRAVIETRGMNNNSTPVVEVPLYLDGEELARGIYNGRQSYEGRMNPVRVGG